MIPFKEVTREQFFEFLKPEFYRHVNVLLEPSVTEYHDFNYDNSLVAYYKADYYSGKATSYWIFDE